MKESYSPEEKFCVRYLLEHGINSTNFTKVVLTLKNTDVKYELVKSTTNVSFFDELAGKLRELWPPGEKDGKWPWRDSVSNLSRRLETLWRDRGLKDKTIDECLSAARKYLAQFEDNVKYMQTLKYFIMKKMDGSSISTNPSLQIFLRAIPNSRRWMTGMIFLTVPLLTRENLFNCSNMKKISKSLFGWADAFIIIAVLLFVASFIGFVINSAWVGSTFSSALLFVVLAPFARGFGVLVQNAEEEMAHRFDVKLEKSDDEK